MAFGTTLSRGEVAVASRDAHPASRMIKRAMIAGIIATGVSVRDLRVATAAVNRFTVMHSRAPGGFHVQISDRDPERLQVLFFEGDALPASEGTRKDVEKYFNRQETRRALLNQLGELRFPPRAQEAYMAGLIGGLDIERIRSARFRIALDYPIRAPASRWAAAASDARRSGREPRGAGPGRAGDPRPSTCRPSRPTPGG